MVVLDFSKAFDRFPHQRLFRKLRYYAIRWNIHSWLSSFLLGRVQCVVVEGCSSNNVPVISGQPQESVLGLLLFLLFIKDLPDRISSKKIFFADDYIVYRPIMGREDCTALLTYRQKGHILEVQDFTKYLDVDLQSSLSWKLHIDRISKKANSMLVFFYGANSVIVVGHCILQYGQNNTGIQLVDMESSP